MFGDILSWFAVFVAIAADDLDGDVDRSCSFDKSEGLGVRDWEWFCEIPVPTIPEHYIYNEGYSRTVGAKTARIGSKNGVKRPLSAGC